MGDLDFFLSIDMEFKGIIIKTLNFKQQFF